MGFGQVHTGVRGGAPSEEAGGPAELHGAAQSQSVEEVPVRTIQRQVLDSFAHSLTGTSRCTTTI